MGMKQNFCYDKTLHCSDQLLQVSGQSLSTLIIYNFSDFIHVCVIIVSSVVNFGKNCLNSDFIYRFYSNFMHYIASGQGQIISNGVNFKQ